MTIDYHDTPEYAAMDTRVFLRRIHEMLYPKTREMEEKKIGEAEFAGIVHGVMAELEEEYCPRMFKLSRFKVKMAFGVVKGVLAYGSSGGYRPTFTDPNKDVAEREKIFHIGDLIREKIRERNKKVGYDPLFSPWKSENDQNASA